jgi:hypothetical protein
MSFIERQSDEDEAVARIVETLAREVRLDALGSEPPARTRWLDYDLASMAENRLGVPVDPLPYMATPKRASAASRVRL